MDDTLFIGDRKAFEKFIHEIQKHFNIVEEVALDEYIWCELKKVNDNEIIMKQSNLIKKIKRNFKCTWIYQGVIRHWQVQMSQF